MQESALQQRSDSCGRWFTLSQNRAVNHPVAFLYSSFGAPSTCQRTDCSSTQAATPASVGESCFFFCPPIVCHVTSRALADYAECHHLLCSGLEGVREGKEAEAEEGVEEGGWRMPRPGAARLGTLLIVITAARCDAGVSPFSREASAGIRITAASTTPQCYGRGGQGELNHVTL